MYPKSPQTLNTYVRKEIRAYLRDEFAVSVTMAVSAVDIPLGTVIGLVTTTGEYKPYKASATDGTEVAKLILAEPVPASTEPLQAAAYPCGYFYKDRLIGVDTAALQDLGAREIQPNIILVPGC